MNTRALLVALALGGGCLPRPGPDRLELALGLLSSDADGEYEEGFRRLLGAGPEAEPFLRQALATAPGRGFPLVAALYVAGSGEEVPLEFRVRHLARFDWPRGGDEEFAIVVPYVRAQIERDLVRTGRPALRPLAEGLAEEASSEGRAMDLVGIILRIGGRGAAEALAGLLDSARDLGGGLRVRDVAAGALLYLGRQDLLLRAPSTEGLVRGAREWWSRAKDQPETEWIRQAARALAEAWAPGDASGVREVLELLVGETIPDPAAWRAGNPDWRPPPPPVHPEGELPKLEAGRSAAWAANRALEEATGLRLWAPRARTLGALRSALRLWQPPPELGVRWRRLLESRYLRLGIAVVGYRADRGANHLLWYREKTAHSTEDPSGKLDAAVGEEAYLLYAQAMEQGTRLVYGEYHESPSGRRTVLRELPILEPVVLFSPAFKAVVILWVEEVPGRRTPRALDELFLEVHRRLRHAARTSSPEGRRRALRALGYFQDPSDLELLRGEKAAEALLLLGDPAGMTPRARLEPYEIEMALRKGQAPDLRAFLERMGKERESEGP